MCCHHTADDRDFCSDVSLEKFKLMGGNLRFFPHLATVVDKLRQGHGMAMMASGVGGQIVMKTLLIILTRRESLMLRLLSVVIFSERKKSQNSSSFFCVHEAPIDKVSVCWNNTMRRKNVETKTRQGLHKNRGISIIEY